MKAVTVIGIGDDGCVGLSSKAMGAVVKAQVLAGGLRHLDFFPQFEGERIIFKDEIGKAIDRIAELAHENSVCVLASGDPLFYGIGSLISKKVGATHVDFIPAPSSIQSAFAKVGLKWDDAHVITLHGKAIDGLVVRLQNHSKVACLTDSVNQPQLIAQHMREFGEVDWTAHVCENLGGSNERVRTFTLLELCEMNGFSPLNVVILVRNNSQWQRPALVPYVHEDEYAKLMPKNGLITKREVRVLSLAALQIRPRSVVWDIGAGSGSVSIEAARLAYEGRVYAIEVDPEGVEICRQNAKAHRTDNVRVIAGRAPEALHDLEDPDAVFVGGSKGSMGEILELALRRLRPGGRVVANAITLDNVSEAYTSLRALGIMPEVTMLNISRGEKLAHYVRYDAMNPIHIFAATKPEEQAP